MKSKKSFNEKCYSILVKVPKGKVTTYKEIARKLNSKAYRAVGNAIIKILMLLKFHVIEL